MFVSKPRKSWYLLRLKLVNFLWEQSLQIYVPLGFFNWRSFSNGLKFGIDWFIRYVSSKTLDGNIRKTGNLPQQIFSGSQNIKHFPIGKNVPFPSMVRWISNRYYDVVYVDVRLLMTLPWIETSETLFTVQIIIVKSWTP